MDNNQKQITKFNPIIVIPARMGATRFYGKPLQKVGGVPMIIKIMHQASQANIGKVVVATPDKEIQTVVQNNGGEAVLTSNNCASGTDRVAEAVELLDPQQHHNIVINLQGDLAMFNNELLTHTLQALIHNYHTFDIATPCALITNEQQKCNPNTVKAVISFNNSKLNTTYNNCGKALYFTRSTCPYGKGPLYQHFGIYTYKRAALKLFVSSSPSELESREKLEQLRALENNQNILAVVVNNSAIEEVNTPQDLEHINATHYSK